MPRGQIDLHLYKSNDAYSLALGNEELYDALEARLPRMFENGGRPRWERPQDQQPRWVMGGTRCAQQRTSRDPDGNLRI
jgi:hypothetical protein